MENLHDLSDEELLDHVQSFLGSQRHLLARLIQYLSEVEDRRLHLKAAYSSMFEFCTRKFRMSEGEAFRRLTAARLLRKFPVIFELVETGAIHLSTLVLLRHHLTDDNHAELLREASGRGKNEVQALLAARSPKPDVEPRIRKLPSLRPRAAESQALPFAPAAPSGGGQVAAAAARAVVRPSRTEESRVEPLSATRYKVQFTADEQLKAKLDRARDLLRHVNPRGDLAIVVERGVDLLLADLEKKKLGKTDRPRRARKSKPGAVTRAARREVFERDDARCTFVSADGRQCEERGWLEIDHLQARALGGSGEIENLRVLCRFHNQLRAEETFGTEHVQNRIHLRQRKCKEETPGSIALRPASVEPPAIEPLPSVEPPPSAERELSPSPREQVEAKVFEALCKMGFRKQQVGRAMVEVRKRQVKLEPEPLLRAGLALLVPG